MASPAATCLGRGGMVLLGRFGGGKEIVGSGRRKKHAPAAAAHHAEAGKTGTRRQAGRCVRIQCTRTVRITLPVHNMQVRR